MAVQARLPAVALSLLHPLIQRLRRAAYLACDRDDRRPPRRMLMLVIQHHPHRTPTDLRRKLVRCLACHRPTFSRVGASDKPGAVQSVNLDLRISASNTEATLSSHPWSENLGAGHKGCPRWTALSGAG